MLPLKMNKELSRIIKDTKRRQRCNFSRAMAVTVILWALIVLAGSAFSQEIVRTVKAKEGDTVKKVADREKIDALKLAEYNRLLPDSVLGAGREILIPIWLSAPKIKIVSPPSKDPPSAGQSKMSTTSGKSPAVTWDVRTFGYSSIDKLPPRYHGHSYGDVLQSLSKVSRQLAKDEFETTEAYNQRLSKMRSQRLVGFLTHSDRLAFNFLPHQDGFHISYDADKQTLNFIIEWARNSNYDWVHSGDYVRRFFSLTWSDNSRKIGSYVGRNVFNRAVPVSVYRNYIYHLMSEEKWLDRFSVDRGSLGVVIHGSVEMPAAVAKSAKSNARLLVIGRLAQMPLLLATDRSEPTIHYPKDEHIVSFGMNFVVEEIWVYDFPTGRVWTKFGPR